MNPEGKNIAQPSFYWLNITYLYSQQAHYLYKESIKIVVSIVAILLHIIMDDRP